MKLKKKELYSSYLSRNSFMQLYWIKNWRKEIERFSVENRKTKRKPITYQLDNLKP